MITLIGHGYIGDSIQKELQSKKIAHNWISHTDEIPEETTVIINAAGYTGVPNVDACESKKQATIDGNVLFPITLEINNPHIPIVHISSGCVYTGYKDGGWTEDDEPNFGFDNGSFYSATKNLAQHLLKPYLDKSYLFRIRMPFGDEDCGKNYLSKLNMYDKLIDFENSLSYVNDVAEAAIFFALEFPPFGIYNCCNPGSKTTKQVAEMMGLEKQWFTEEEFKTSVVSPRSNCVLNNDKMNAIFKLKPIDEALEIAINSLKV